jgi:hypothetical protein
MNATPIMTAERRMPRHITPYLPTVIVFVSHDNNLTIPVQPHLGSLTDVIISCNVQGWPGPQKKSDFHSILGAF